MVTRIAKSLLFSSYLFFTSVSAALAQVVATDAASPSPTPTMVGAPDGGATTSALPGAGISSPTIILLVLGSFFLLLGGYKFFQAFKD